MSFISLMPNSLLPILTLRTVFGKNFLLTRGCLRFKANLLANPFRITTLKGSFPNTIKFRDLYLILELL